MNLRSGARRYRFLVVWQTAVCELHSQVPPRLHGARDPRHLGGLRGRRKPILDRLRAELAKDDRWERSMLAPWRPFGEEQHLIIWLDLAERRDKVILGDQVAVIVGGILPGVTLGRVELQPP